MISLSNENKTKVSLSNESKDDSLIWNNASGNWNEATHSKWSNPKLGLSRTSKTKISLSNENK